MKTLTYEEIMSLLAASANPKLDVYRIIRDDGNNGRYLWYPAPLVTPNEQLDAANWLDLTDDTTPHRDWYTLIEHEIGDFLDELDARVVA